MSLKSLLIGAVIAAFAVVSMNATAEEKAAGAMGAKKAGAMEELTLTGKIIMKEDVKGEAKVTEKIEKDKEVIEAKETEKITCKFALVDADGAEIALPMPKAKAGEKAIDLAAFVGKSVKVVAKGKTTTVEGKKHVKVTKIVSVTEEAAAPAPAAP